MLNARAAAQESKMAIKTSMTIIQFRTTTQIVI